MTVASFQMEGKSPSSHILLSMINKASCEIFEDVSIFDSEYHLDQQQFRVLYLVNR